MIFDSLVIWRILSELRLLVLGGSVQKIKQSDDDETMLEIRVPGFTYNLLFSIDSSFARLHLSSSGIKAQSQAPDFCMIMRKYLTGAVIAKIEQLGFDRIIKITLIDNDNKIYYLYHEIMGKHSNLILTNASDRILACQKTVGKALSKVRQILISMDYVLPPNMSRINPLDMSYELYSQVIGSMPPGDRKEELRYIIGNFSGISPFLAEEIWYNIDIKDIESGWNAIENIKKLCESPNERSCYLIKDDQNRAVNVYPILLKTVSFDNQVLKDSINETIDVAFKGIISRKLLEDTRNSLLVSIDRSISYRKSAIKSCERSIEKAKNSNRQKEIGDLLIASAHCINKGDLKVSVVDYYDSNMPVVEIDLDPKLSPVENANRYFKKYKKLKEAARLAEDRLITLWDNLDILNAERERASIENKVSELKSMHKSLIEKGFLRIEVSDQEAQHSEFDGYKIKRLYSPEGWEVLCGETSTANDFLTTRLARSNDIWFHARQITGAHVIIRTTAKTAASVPFNTIIFAAKLAALNSDAKHSRLVPVDYTFRKYVRKPRGAAPGFVLYKMEKTLDIEL